MLSFSELNRLGAEIPSGSQRITEFSGRLTLVLYEYLRCREPPVVLLSLGHHFFCGKFVPEQLSTGFEHCKLSRLSDWVDVAFVDLDSLQLLTPMAHTHFLQQRVLQKIVYFATCEANLEVLSIECGYCSISMMSFIIIAGLPAQRIHLWRGTAVSFVVAASSQRQCRFCRPVSGAVSLARRSLRDSVCNDYDDWCI